jgi:hypothetical protein
MSTEATAYPNQSQTGERPTMIEANPWAAVALIESGLIIGALLAPVYNAVQEALSSMGAAVEEDVEDDVTGK